MEAPKILWLAVGCDHRRSRVEPAGTYLKLVGALSEILDAPSRVHGARHGAPHGEGAISVNGAAVRPRPSTVGPNGPEPGCQAHP